jgi:hypothetical protein
MRIVDGVILVRARRDVAERTGVEEFATPESGIPEITIALTPINTPGADARLRGNIT